MRVQTLYPYVYRQPETSVKRTSWKLTGVLLGALTVKTFQ